MLKTGELI